MQNICGQQRNSPMADPIFGSKYGPQNGVQNWITFSFLLLGFCLGSVLGSKFKPKSGASHRKILLLPADVLQADLRRTSMGSMSHTLLFSSYRLFAFGMSIDAVAWAYPYSSMQFSHLSKKINESTTPTESLLVFRLFETLGRCARGFRTSAVLFVSHKCLDGEFCLDFVFFCCLLVAISMNFDDADWLIAVAMRWTAAASTRKMPLNSVPTAENKKLHSAYHVDRHLSLDNGIVCKFEGLTLRFMNVHVYNCTGSALKPALDIPA